MKNAKQILETLRLQPLTDEEKKSRHILGRLYGPIATCEESTRNGRKYNRELWEKALADDVFREKVANKSLFLELGHPSDREETDMEKICACIPELPKIVDGDLYAYVDILDTANGRLLKTLCDYGFVPGISSRGSGDIMPNDEVDPETFFLETWDIVQLPAVKKARLKMCESVDEGELRLKKALNESYNSAEGKEKEAMKEALDNLSISIDEASEEPITMDDIPYDEDEAVLNEAGEEAEMESIPAEDADEKPAEDVEKPAEAEQTEEEAASEEDGEGLTEVEIPLDDAIDAVKATADGIKDAIDASKKEEKKIDEVVSDVADTLAATAGGEENSEESEEPSEDTAKEELPEDEEPEGGDKDEAKPEGGADEEEEEKKSDEAEDSGLEEALSCLKEAIRQKDALEEENRKLRESKAVGDAEVRRLGDRLSECEAQLKEAKSIASASKEFEERIRRLAEQLGEKDDELRSLREERDEARRLDESMRDGSAEKAKRLTEKLDEMRKELSEAESELSDEKSRGREKLSEAVKVAKAYKESYARLMEHYIEYKASMLSVRPADVKAKLKENYTESDVDEVCEELLEAPQYCSNSLFSGLKSGSRLSINESAEPKKIYSSEGGYDIDDDLLEMAGLK